MSAKLKIGILGLCLYTFSFVAQTVSPTFEGQIVYANTYISKNPKLEGKRLGSMLGTIHYYYVKGGDYKTVTNGHFAQWQLYLNKDNRIYNKMASSDTVFWNNAAEHDDEVLGSKLNKNVITILGYLCDELILTCRSGVHKYYFNTKLRLDSKLYVKHRYANYYSYLSKTNAVPLKMILEDVEFTMESVAKEIKPGKLDPSLFVIPATTKTAKSLY